MALAEQVELSVLLKTIEVGGLVAFACSGFIEAHRKNMDMVGVFTIGFIAAFGGGTMRDLLLDQRPWFWVQQYQYVVLIFCLAIALTPFLHHLGSALSEKIINIADALGLGLFSVLGTSVAESAGMPIFISVMIGVVTGTSGGVLRDILCNEIPLVLRRRHLYAFCAFVGCWVYVVLDQVIQSSELITLSASIAVTCIMRYFTERFKIRFLN